ncbi:MAG: segregation/condensation protein A [Planctomycetota bacterium]|nr:segregation/condensation protein A [Planctomycetota bacterium]
MLADDYRVQLEVFEGPLDLLLYLIRKNQVDVHDIPIAAITEQYTSFLSQLKSIDIDAAGDFLVMAATLTEIKARLIAPSPTPTPDEGNASGPGDGPAGGADGEGGSAGVELGGVRAQADADPRADLVRQLLEYKKYRDAADALEGRFQEWNSRFPVHAKPPPRPAASAARPEIEDEAREGEPATGAVGSEGELAGGRGEVGAQSLGEDEVGLRALELYEDDLELADLVRAFQRIAETVDFNRLGTHDVKYEDTPIEQHAENIVARLRDQTRPGWMLASEGAQVEGGAEAKPTGLTMRELFTGRSRREMIGLFLALLDLVKRRQVRVRQEAIGGDIALELEKPEEPDATGKA